MYIRMYINVIYIYIHTHSGLKKGFVVAVHINHMHDFNHLK